MCFLPRRSEKRLLYFTAYIYRSFYLVDERAHMKFCFN